MQGRRGSKALFALTAAVALAAATAVAEAGTISFVGDSSSATGYRMGSGGEFKATITGFGTLSPMGANVQITAGTFQTFCLEVSENLTLDGAAFAWSDPLGTSAVGGGGGPNPDPISNQTAWLYTQFWNGTLTGTYSSVAYAYDFSDLGDPTGADGSLGRNASAGALQRVIWQFEQEIGSTDADLVSGLGSGAANAARAWKAAADAAVAGGWVNTNVRVVNPTWLANSYGRTVGSNAQSVLILVPLPPAAFAGLGLMAGLGALGVIRRRNRATLN